MLDTAIEIEGLIRILKDGDASQEAIDLLREKVTHLLDETVKIPDVEISANNEVPVQNDVPTHNDTPADKESIKEDEILSEDKIATDNSDDILLFTEDETPDNVCVASDNIHTTPDNNKEKIATDLKKYFSLNDRYLYSRELFGGDMKMFDSTLKFLEGIKDFSDIEDYFYSELEWNPEDANVASFLEILRPHFQE